jgi:hypothetical protein
MFSDQLTGRLAKESSTGNIDAGEEAIHVARVNDVGGLLDDLAVVFLNTVALDQASGFDQQLFIAERKFQVVVGSRVEAFDAILGTVHSTTDQEDRNVRGTRIVL